MEPGSPLGELLTVSTLKTTVFLLHKRFWQICSGVEAIAGCSAGDRARVGRRGRQPCQGRGAVRPACGFSRFPRWGVRNAGGEGPSRRALHCYSSPLPLPQLDLSREFLHLEALAAACAGCQVGPSRPLPGPGRWAHGTGASSVLRASILMPLGGLGKTGGHRLASPRIPPCLPSKA